MRFAVYILTLTLTAMLPAQMAKAGSGEELAGYCLGETRVAGSYMVKAKGRIAEVSPIENTGASQAGAEIVNECIAKRAAQTLAGYARERQRYLPVQVQRKEIMKCRRKLGFGGRLVMAARWKELPLSRQTDIWLLPSDGMTAADADRVNACADRALNREPTPRSTADYASAGSTRSGIGFCPKNASVLYGGTTYCVGK